MWAQIEPKWSTFSDRKFSVSFEKNPISGFQDISLNDFELKFTHLPKRLFYFKKFTYMSFSQLLYVTYHAVNFQKQF